MYQGETITITMSGFPVPVSDIENLYIIFKTSSKVLLEKTLSDCTIDGETISFKFSQEDSLRFPPGPMTRSLIIVTHDGSRFESIPSAFECLSTAKQEVLL